MQNHIYHNSNKDLFKGPPDIRYYTPKERTLRANSIAERQFRHMAKTTESWDPAYPATQLKYGLLLLMHMTPTEISALHLSDILNVRGEIKSAIKIRAEIATDHTARSIPMHPTVAAALTAYRRAYGHNLSYLAATARYGIPKKQSAAAIQIWLKRKCHQAGVTTSSAPGDRRVYFTILNDISHKGK
jgi:integrase